MRNYKKSNRAGFTLEEWIADKLKVIDPNAKPTKNSGASGSIGDISNKFFYIECKQKMTKSNIIVDYKKEYLKLYNEIPMDSLKPILIVTENKQREKFITINAEDFFRLIYKVYKEE